MGFTIGLPRNPKQHDVVMVVVNELSKVGHFISMKSTHKTINIVQLFIKDIFRLHGTAKEIISYWDVKSTSIFWKDLFLGFGTQLAFNTTYHPQSNGQLERVNMIL